MVKNKDRMLFFMVTCFFFSSCSVCRICYEDNCVETLISPCRCSGTMGKLGHCYLIPQ